MEHLQSVNVNVDGPHLLCEDTVRPIYIVLLGNWDRCGPRNEAIALCPLIEVIGSTNNFESINSFLPTSPQRRLKQIAQNGSRRVEHRHSGGSEVITRGHQKSSSLDQCFFQPSSRARTLPTGTFQVICCVSRQSKTCKKALPSNELHVTRAHYDFSIYVLF